MAAPATLQNLADQFGVDYSFNYQLGDQTGTVTSDTPKLDNATLYTHQSLNFQLSVPNDWETEERGSSVEFIPASGSGSINFEAFDDPSFYVVDQIDREFCDTFGEGFRSGLGVDSTIADQFTFELFTLNGNTGCRAEGSLFEGINQRYYVFFSNEDSQVYSIFFTSTSKSEESELATVMDTFTIK
ncbi:MAG: hypothetical protein ACE5DX_03630 [Candidatus Dojkabacteria bacterium]